MQSKRLRIILTCVVALILFSGLLRVYYRLTDDFRLSNITYDMSNEPIWEIPAPSSAELTAIHQVLGQKFYYIGKGAQSYAFGSEDQKYVLKFFKFKHLRPNWLARLIPPIPPFTEFKERIVERKKRQLHGVFEGYALAYRANKEGAGLIFVHLVPTNYLKQKVTVVDKIGIERQIDLDDVVFLIQKKGETFRQRMVRQLNQNQMEAAKESIYKILAMYVTEYQKGVYDRDHGVMHNTGFVQDTPFHLDVGKFSKEDKMRQVEFYKKDLLNVVWKIDTWIKSVYPEQYPALSAYIAEEYQQYTGDQFDPSTLDPNQFIRRRR